MAFAWLEFPEDLGECKHGIPASIWHFKSMTNLTEQGFRRCAIMQCHLAAVSYKKPTGFIANMPELFQNPEVHVGWPTFADHDETGRDRRYLGPLPAKCKHDNIHVPLIGKDATGAFRTTATAAYHPPRDVQVAC